MEINTGALKTILSEDTYGKLRDVLGPLEKTRAVLSTYTAELDPSDPVFVKDFSSPKSWQKGTVVSRTGPVSALVELQDGRIVRRHQDDLRKDPSASQQSQESKSPGPVDPEYQPDESSTPKTLKAKSPRPVRNWCRPQRFKDFEL